jgi:hypothetical protein
VVVKVAVSPYNVKGIKSVLNSKEVDIKRKIDYFNFEM